MILFVKMPLLRLWKQAGGGPQRGEAESLRSLHVTASEGQESWPVGTGRVSAGVLPKSDVSIDQRSLHRRKLAGAEIFPAEQAIHRACAHSTEEHAFGIDPAAFHLL